MKTQAIVSLLILTASVGLNLAENDEDNKDGTEAQEIRTTLERSNYYKYSQDEEDSDSRYRSGKGSETMIEAMPAQSLRELFTSKDGMKFLLNNILLWMVLERFGVLIYLVL